MKRFRLDRETMIPLFFAFSFGMILSNLLGQQKLALNSEQSADYVMTYKGVDMRIADLPEEMGQALSLLNQEHEIEQKELLEQAAVAMLINDYARSNGLGFDQAAEVMFDPGPIEDTAVEAYYRIHSAQLDRPYFEVQEAIRKHLRHQRIMGLRQQKLDNLKAMGDLAIYP